jgi:hypothetical protein
MLPLNIHETYNSLHVVEFKQIDAVNYALNITY